MPEADPPQADLPPPNPPYPPLIKGGKEGFKNVGCARRTLLTFSLRSGVTQVGLPSSHRYAEHLI